jgi:hypothetical protein
MTEADGAVVSVEYGCGAHSGTEQASRPETEQAEVVYDDGVELTVP